MAEPETNSQSEKEKATNEWMDLLLQEDWEDVEVIIEIPKGSRVKYEYDKSSERIICDRVLSTPFTYFFNYGYIANTLSEDGDPIDVVVLMEDSLIPNCSIQCRLLGVLETSDEKGSDPKLIMCPISKIDPSYEQWEGILDVSIAILNKLKYFFSHYKDLEKGKYVHVGDFLGKEQAKQHLVQSKLLYFSSMVEKDKWFEMI